MPLRFVHVLDNIPKGEFTFYLENVLASFDKWVTNYALDMKLSYSKLTDLERVLSFIPPQEPLFYLSGEYDQQLIENEDILHLLTQNVTYAIATKLRGVYGVEFQLNLYPNECPFFRSLDCYDPEVDMGNCSELEIYPYSCSPIDDIDNRTRRLGETHVDEKRRLPVNPTEDFSLRRTLYHALHEHLNLPPFDQFLKMQFLPVSSGEIKMYYGKPSAGSLTFSFPRHHDEKVIRIIRAAMNLAVKPESTWITMVGSFDELRSFLLQKRIRQIFKMRKCGFHTAAMGHLGHLPNINNESLQSILACNKSFSDIILKWNHVSCTFATSIDYNGSACLQGGGRKYNYRYDFLLHLDDLESEKYTEFTRKAGNISGLPFEDINNWFVVKYTGRRYDNTIKQIEQFTHEARQICSSIREMFHLAGKRSCYTFENRPIVLPGSYDKHGIKFNAIIKQVMKQRQFTFSYDKDASTPIWARVAYLNKDNFGSYCYITFRGDPRFESREFDVEFEVRAVSMKRATLDPPQWKFSVDLEELLGERNCWYFDSPEHLVEQANNAVDFIEDIGVTFFGKIGPLLEKYLHRSGEDKQRVNQGRGTTR